MRYVEDKPFMVRTGKQFRIKDGDKESEATVGDVLKLVVNNYTPNAQVLVLDMPDLRKWNKALDILDGEPEQHNGAAFWAFEDADFEVVKRIVNKFGPLIMPSQAPLLYDALEAAVTELKATEPTKAE